MTRMDDQPATVPAVRLSAYGQTYVATVAVVALITLVAETEAWYVALVVLCLPLSLLALWVSFYAGLAAGFAAGHDPAHMSWLVGVAWVGVWTATAWVNARMAEKLLRSGWAALRVGPRAEYDEDESSL